MNPLIVLLIGLLIPASKPCLQGFSSDGSLQGFLRGETGIQCLQSLPALESKLKLTNYFLRSKELENILLLIPEVKPLLPHLPVLLGQNKPTTYLILLQNNHEMRANGGFFGSYAVAEVSPRTVGLSSNAGTAAKSDSSGVALDDSPEVTPFTVRFQDIYVPDGALPGHVDPPAPIQTAFQQGWYKLRDSDWEPDFPTAAKTIRWFFEKGGEISPDVLVTINLATIEKIVSLIGEIYVPEYDLKLDSDTLYTLLQNKAEIDFFPGSTQKKDVLTAAGRALIKKLSDLNPSQYLAIANLLVNELNHGNLLLNAKDTDVQKTIETKDWAGKINLLPTGSAPEGQLLDTVLLVETNMGANKANCCTDRKTTHTITKGETEINHLVNITFTNNSIRENPLPPRFYGGNYISYLRIYIPKNAIDIRLTAQPTLPKTLTQYPTPFNGINNNAFDRKFAYGLTEVGFFHLTAAGTKSAVQLSYELPLDGLNLSPNNTDSSGVAPDDSPEVAVKQVGPSYQLTILKQHGLEKSPQEINLFGKTSATDLPTDFSTSTPL